MRLPSAVGADRNLEIPLLGPRIAFWPLTALGAGQRDTMTLDRKTAAIGVLAGITAALLVLGAFNQTGLAFVLYSISTLPILIAGLGWGNLAAAIAIVAGGAVIGLSVSAKAALIVSAVSFLPAGWISHLANLARPASELGGPKDMIAWYPLPNVLLHLCALVTIAAAITGYVIGYSPELVSKMVDMTLEISMQDPAAPALDPAAVSTMKRLMLYLLPLVQGMSWVFTQFFSYYIATRIVATSGRSVRPREDMTSSLRMNRNAIFIFLGSMLLSFAGGPLGLVGAAACGAFGAGFLMAGFASIHFRSRGKAGRLPLLILTYLSCIVLAFPAIIVLVMGLADTRQAIPLTSAPGNGTDGSKTV